MAPNYLIVTCVFPTLWADWFCAEMELSAVQRIAAEEVQLESFGPAHAARFLTAQLNGTVQALGLPSPTYPFTDGDLAAICRKANSPRQFIQAVRKRFNDWLDGIETADEPAVPEAPRLEDMDAVVADSIERFDAANRLGFVKGIPIEHDLVGRIDTILRTLLAGGGPKPTFARLKDARSRVMPPNIVVRADAWDAGVSLAVSNAEGNSFTSRLRNFVEALRDIGGPARGLLVRDNRCRRPGPVGRQLLAEFQEVGGRYLEVDQQEWAKLNALYDTMVAVEGGDLTLDSLVIDRAQFVESVGRIGACRETAILREAANRSRWIADAIRHVPPPAAGTSPA